MTTTSQNSTDVLLTRKLTENDISFKIVKPLSFRACDPSRIAIDIYADFKQHIYDEITALSLPVSRLESFGYVGLEPHNISAFENTPEFEQHYNYAIEQLNTHLKEDLETHKEYLINTLNTNLKDFLVNHSLQPLQK